MIFQKCYRALRGSRPDPWVGVRRSSKYLESGRGRNVSQISRAGSSQPDPTRPDYIYIYIYAEDLLTRPTSWAMTSGQPWYKPKTRNIKEKPAGCTEYVTLLSITTYVSTSGRNQLSFYFTLLPCLRVFFSIACFLCFRRASYYCVHDTSEVSVFGAGRGKSLEEGRAGGGVDMKVSKRHMLSCSLPPRAIWRTSHRSPAPSS